MSPWRRSKALSAAIQPPAAAVGTVDGQTGRTNLDRGPDAAVKGRGDHSRILGRDASATVGHPAGVGDGVDRRAGVPVGLPPDPRRLHRALHVVVVAVIVAVVVVVVVVPVSQ